MIPCKHLSCDYIIIMRKTYPILHNNCVRNNLIYPPEKERKEKEGAKKDVRKKIYEWI